METILRYENVEISFGRNPIVQDVSFSLRRGEIIGLVGESGSGKSSLLKAGIGLLGSYGVVTRGNILFDEKNIPDLSERELQSIRGNGIGMIFQDAGASFCPIRTIGAQITESVRAHSSISKKEMKAKALDMFEKLNLRDGVRIWNSYPFELSGGMNQRVGIACAMLLNPSVLLADEPTSALDTVSAGQVIEEMLRVRDLFGTSIVLVTHDLEVVNKMADRIMVLQDGTVRERTHHEAGLERKAS